MLVLASAVVSLGLSWTSFGRQIDDYAYDFLFRLEQPAPWRPDAIILALDEATLSRYGGLRGMRLALAHGLGLIRDAHPAAVAVDLILAEPGDSESDARLEEAFAHIYNLVLSCDLFPDASGWEDPIPRFRKYAVGIGQVHADLDKYDAVSRELPLEKVAGHDRRWALALETYRAQKGGEMIESPADIEVSGVRIPSNAATGRSLRIRYAPIAMG